jgi:hypothetical protein
MQAHVWIGDSDTFVLRSYAVPRPGGPALRHIIELGDLTLDFPPGELEQLHELIGEHLAAMD